MKIIQCQICSWILLKFLNSIIDKTFPYFQQDHFRLFSFHKKTYNRFSRKRILLIKKLCSDIHADKCVNSLFKWPKILSVKETDSIILWFISDIMGYFCGAEIFQLFLSTGKWEGRGSRADTKGDIIPQRICATSYHEWSIEKHNIGD